MKPTQSPYLFQGLSTGSGFSRDYEAQETIPMDGSRSDLRTYSPFVIRVLPPAILGEMGSDVLPSGLNPQRGPRQGSVRESNRDRTDYSTTVRGISGSPPSYSSYEAMIHNGSAIPGLTSTSVATIQSKYDSARFSQIFGPVTQQSLNGGRIGPTTAITPAMTNDLSALNILLQVKRLMSVPPLLMLINPQSMKVEHTKIAQHQERSRYGFIYQAWGEELPKISFTFKIGAYTVGGSGSQGPSGVQRASRRDSAAFQQLMTLLTIFQSGGKIQDTIQNSRASFMVGNIAIEYDQKTYVGHFDTFNLGEDESQQNGGLQFDMDFTAIRIFDHAQPSYVVSPMTSPSNPFSTSGVGRGTISRSGSQGSAQFLTAPTIGVSGTQTPPQPWAGSSVTSSGLSPVITSRRR